MYFSVLSVKMFSSWTYSSSLLSMFIPAFVYWIIGGMLIWHAPSISGKLFDEDENQESTESIHIHEWYRLAFTITGIGLFFLVVFPDLLFSTASLLFPLEFKNPEKDPIRFFRNLDNIFGRQVFRFFGALAEGGIAIYLVIRAKRLAAFIVRLHNRQPNVSS